MSTPGNTAQLLDQSTVEEVIGNCGIQRNSGEHLRFGGDDREGQRDWERSEKNKRGMATLQVFFL
jgi:hypothetical protein